MNPKVSFIVAIYNVEPYIRECLESLREQKEKNIEFLLIDDGSTDLSGSICEEYAIMDNRFQVFHQENKGVSVARNKGIEMAAGDWLCFVDGDDMVDPKLMNNLQFEQFSECDLIFFGYNNLYANGKHEKRALPNLSVPNLDHKDMLDLSHGILNGDIDKCKKYQNTCFSYHEPWGKLYNKKFIDEYNLRYQIGIKRGQDSLFNFEVYQCAKKALFEPVIGYYYRKNQLSISNRYNPQITESYVELINAFWNVIEKNKCKQDYIQDAYLMGIRSFLYCCKIDFCHENNEKNYSERKKDFLRVRNMEIYRLCFENANYSKLRLNVRFSAILCKYHFFAAFMLFWRIYDCMKNYKNK